LAEGGRGPTWGQRLFQAHPGYLAGCRILVVEDEPLIALDLVQTLERHGAEVVGPAMGVAEALALLAGHLAINTAVLDVQLAHELAWPVADALAARGVPFVFTTGYQATDTPPAYAAVPRLLKPIDPPELARLLCLLR
jgi:CheY-like chemotaxis protein